MLELLSLDYDAKLQTYCVNARCDYDWFLKVTQQIENIPDIQRNISKNIHSKAYTTLRTALKQGCLLPPVVLAVNNVTMPDKLKTGRESVIDNQVEQELLGTLTEPLKNRAPVYLMDGFQRHYAIKRISEEFSEDSEEERQQFLSKRLHLEIWLNIPFNAIAYRMFLINAGQQPLSIRQQVEILRLKLQEELAAIPLIRIMNGSRLQKRTQKGQFHIVELSHAFQAWLEGRPNLELRNPAITPILAQSAINLLDASLDNSSQDKNTFKDFVAWLVNLDYALPEEQLEFLSDEIVLRGIAAAIGDAQRSTTLSERMRRMREELLEKLRGEPSRDHLGIQTFEELKKSMDNRKVNVEQETGYLVFRAFQEYFISEGMKTMPECWQIALTRI
jgi:hypothetical protein